MALGRYQGMNMGGPGGSQNPQLALNSPKYAQINILNQGMMNSPNALTGIYQQDNQLFNRTGPVVLNNRP